jgi:putative acetyltransferase
MSSPDTESCVDRVTIRTQRPDERPRVREVITRSFGDAVVADLAEALQDAPAGVDGLSFVADLDGGIVGHVQLSKSWLDAPRSLVEVLVLSPLAVAPECQRHGIGGRLVIHALDEAARLGAPMVFLEGSPRYYRRFGFQTASQRGFTAPSVRIPDAAFQVVLLPSAEPWMTGALVYAEQFWAFDCVGLRDPDV